MAEQRDTSVSWSWTDDASARLTPDVIRDAAKTVLERSSVRKPCSHLVSPRALDRPGVYRCHWCGVPVEIPYPLRERA